MRENVRAEKERLHPDGTERRHLGELSAGLRRCDQGRIRRVVIAASRNKRDSASVIAGVRVSVNARVQLRRNTQQQRPEKRCADERCNKSAAAFLRTRKRAHCTTSLSPARLSRKQISW